jgi:hypothetical protein
VVDLWSAVLLLVSSLTLLSALSMYYTLHRNNMLRYIYNLIGAQGRHFMPGDAGPSHWCGSLLFSRMTFTGK